MSDEYRTELEFGNPQSDKTLIDEITRLVFKRIKSELKFDKTYVAKVVAVGTGVADVQIEDSVNTIAGVKNRSGETLNINDYVYIEAINNSLTNIVIKYKK